MESLARAYDFLFGCHHGDLEPGFYDRWPHACRVCCGCGA